MRAVFITCLLLLAATAAPGYIHVPPETLKGVCKNASWVRVLTVKNRNVEKGGVTFEVTEVVRENKRWKSGVTTFKLLAPPDTPGRKTVLDQHTPGSTVVLFSSEGEGKNPFAFGYACYGRGWYSVHYSVQGACWLLLRHEPDLSLCYHGDVKELPGHVRSVLAGKDVKVPTMAPAERVDHFERVKQIEAAMRKNKGEK